MNTKMKKIILTISIILMTCVSVSAQGGNDAFINDWGGGRNSDPINSGLIVALPSWSLFGEQDPDPGAPLGSGLLIMTALGAGYAVTRKLKKN
ncbi:MAG: hypothetical protein CW336_08755 [Bacteroidetes bacterium]|nr:hypothetical protein [Bacteroidota bacterium]